MLTIVSHVEVHLAYDEFSGEDYAGDQVLNESDRSRRRKRLEERHLLLRRAGTSTSMNGIIDIRVPPRDIFSCCRPNRRLNSLPGLQAVEASAGGHGRGEFPLVQI